MTRRPFFPNQAAAIAAGFTVDTTCSPWIAYKGPRFTPSEVRYVRNDDEAELIAALRYIAQGRGQEKHVLRQTAIDALAKVKA